MHVLMGLIVVLIFGYLFYRLLQNGGTQQAAATRTSSEIAKEAASLGVAFVANGKLFHREQGAEPHLLQSSYVQEALDRRERTKQRHSWKQDTSFNIASGGGRRSFQGNEAPIVTTSTVFDRHSNSLLYFIKDEIIGGLFASVPGSSAEQRVLLKQGLHLTDLNLSPDGQMLCASSRQDEGIANIAVLARDGSKLREVTSGDTVDASPAWIPGVENRLLFQSCGFARDAQGYVIAQSNATIQMLNLETGELAPILEDARFDFIKPRVDAQGNLLFIRRPYELPKYSAANFFSDTLFFPFRLLRAVFHYLNFFSLMYSRKPLTSATGPMLHADIKNIILQGKRIDAEKALRQESRIHGVPSLVPASWQLVSRNQQGAECILATNVASYDLCSNGRIVYSNGRGVFMLGNSGESALVLKSDLIAEVCAASVG